MSRNLGTSMKSSGVPERSLITSNADDDQSFIYKNAGGPVNSDFAGQINCFGNCLGRTLVITGALEASNPTTGHAPNSAHNTGDAVDFGKHSNQGLSRDDFEGECFEFCFNPYEEGVYGQEEGPPRSPHFHVQDIPGRGGAVGFAPGVH